MGHFFKYSIVVLAFIWGLVGPVMAQDVVVVIRTFIPGEHPSKPGWMVPVPGMPGRTMMPDLGIGQCFGSDSRTFSNQRIESSRFGGIVVISPSAMDPVSGSTTTGVTHEYECGTGNVVCEETSGVDGFSISEVKSSGGVLSFNYSGAASNPCLTVAPRIKFNGAVVVDTNSKTVSIDGNNDVFPAFEAFVISGGKTTNLFQMNPKDGATPLDLVTSSANRKVSKKISY